MSPLLRTAAAVLAATMLATRPPAAKAVTCGAGTVHDIATDTCIVAPAGQGRRQAAGSPRLATADGDLTVALDGGRFKVTKQDGSTQFLDENVNTVASAIQLGYTLFSDVRELHNVIDVRETLRTEIAAVANVSRQDVNTLRDTVGNQLATFQGQMSATIADANTSLTGTVASLTACADQGLLMNGAGECVNPVPQCPGLERITVSNNGSLDSADLVEPVVGVQVSVKCTNASTGPVPALIQCLSNGSWSSTSPRCQACSDLPRNGEGRECVKCVGGRCLTYKAVAGTVADPARDCLDLKVRNDEVGIALPSGFYYIRPTGSGSPYEVFCEMEVDGGGWTLVSSVYDTSVSSKRAGDDRWTSSPGGHAVANWAGTTTFGSARRATFDDYKSKGYSEISASNIMMWHVTRNAPTDQWDAQGQFKYYTENNFLATRTPRNMRGIFTGQQSLTPSGRRCGGRLVVPMTWETQNADRFYSFHMAPNWVNGNMGAAGRNKIEFSSGTDWSNSIFAVCPGSSAQASCGNHEHACVGGIMNADGRWMSDFTAQDWNGYRCANCNGYQWSTSGWFVRAPILFFIR